MAPAAMGANTRPPDRGAGLRPPGPPGPPGRTSAAPPTHPTTGRGYSSAKLGLLHRQEPATGETPVRRHYTKIINDSTSTNFPILLQISLLKIYDKDKPETKPKNLSELHISDLITDILKIPLTSCIELDNQTGRYDKKELQVRSNTNLDDALTGDTPKHFKDHEVRVTIISNASDI